MSVFHSRRPSIAGQIHHSLTLERCRIVEKLVMKKFEDPEFIQSTRKHSCAKQIIAMKDAWCTPCVKARSFCICYFILFLKQLCDTDVLQMRKKPETKET